MMFIAFGETNARDACAALFPAFSTTTETYTEAVIISRLRPRLYFFHSQLLTRTKIQFKESIMSDTCLPADIPHL
jgi:hypothetical protein